MGAIEWEIVVLLCIGVLLVVVDTGETWKVKTKACPQGCNSCSLFNGCITCKPRYLLMLHRSGMKQQGYCRRTCPSGYYASRGGGDINRCSKCRVDNCESCLTRSLCIRCRPPYYAHDGRCHTQCPQGKWADRKTGECLDTVDCEVSDWSNWGECRMNGVDCGYKWGLETRYRGITTQPSPGGMVCPELAETRECRMLQRYCPDDGLGPNRHKKKDGTKKKDKRRRNRRRNRGRTQKTRSRTRKKDERSRSPDKERTKPRSRTDEEKSREVSRTLPTDLISI